MTVYRCQWPTGQTNDHADFATEDEALEYAATYARTGRMVVVFAVQVEADVGPGLAETGAVATLRGEVDSGATGNGSGAQRGADEIEGDA